MIENEEEGEAKRHESVISARGTMQEMDDDEPDLSAEFDLSMVPKEKEKNYELTRDVSTSNMLVKRLI